MRSGQNLDEKQLKRVTVLTEIGYDDQPESDSLMIRFFVRIQAVGYYWSKLLKSLLASYLSS